MVNCLIQGKQIESIDSDKIVVDILSVSGDFTLDKHYSIIEVDATAGPVVITLPTVTATFLQKSPILIKRIDDTTNIVTINGTSSNYEDDGIILFGLEGTSVYASIIDFWRSTV